MAAGLEHRDGERGIGPVALSDDAERLYLALVAHDGDFTQARREAGTGWSDALDELVALHLVRLTGQEDRCEVRSPGEAAEAAVAVGEQTAYATLRQAAAIRERLRDLAPHYRRMVRASTTEILTGSEAINARIGEILPLVRATVASAHPTLGNAERLEASLATDRQLLSAGISCRGLFTHAALRLPATLAYLRAETEMGVDVRTTAMIPIRMLIFDNEYAIVPIEADSVAGLITDPIVVALLHDIFGFLWERGRPVAAPADEGTLPGDLEVALLRELAAGRTDDAIARRLGMSTRSLSRQLSALLDSHGVQTRFQLGLVAARAGLVDAPE